MTGARTRVWAAALAPILLAAVAVLAPARASESAFDLRRAPIDSTDSASLQRGAKLFVNYCLGCHGAALITYDRVAEDLRIDEEIMREHLRFGAAASAPLASAMDGATARDWFYQAAPPDLSLIARARGADWLFGYLRHFYRDESSPRRLEQSALPECGDAARDGRFARGGAAGRRRFANRDPRRARRRRNTTASPPISSIFSFMSASRRKTSASAWATC